MALQQILIPSPNKDESQRNLNRSREIHQRKVNIIRNKLDTVIEKLTNIPKFDNSDRNDIEEDSWDSEEQDKTVVYDHSDNEDSCKAQEEEKINDLLKPQKGDFVNLSPRKRNFNKVRFNEESK